MRAIEIEELKQKLAAREATLDAIAYLCADYDVLLSQADSMSEEEHLFEEGQAHAGSEINKLIEASGYVVKDRPEGD